MKSQSVTPKADAQLAKWCEALSTQFAEDEVPQGWVTTKELGEMLKKSNTRISEMLQVAMRQGKCECKKFRISNGGTVRPVPHYRLK